MDTDRPIILFDGVCNLCNGAVNYVIDHDPEGRFLFGPLQSEKAKGLLDRAGLAVDYLDSIVLLEHGRFHVGSDAVLRIARGLEGPVSWLAALRVVPRTLRDAVYRWVARNRYAWFGQRDVCRVPTPELESRFI